MGSMLGVCTLHDNQHVFLWLMVTECCVAVVFLDQPGRHSGAGVLHHINSGSCGLQWHVKYPSGS